MTPKPCPFCGSKSVAERCQDIYERDFEFYRAECSNSDCVIYRHFKTEAEAIAAWNRRVGETK